jgi:DNA-binding NarL/FixJ family response regulator
MTSSEAREPIRVAIVSERHLMGESVAVTLRQQPGLVVVETPPPDSTTAADVDVAIVIDEQRPGAFTSPSWAGRVPTIVIAPFRNRGEVIEAIERGACACVSRDAALSELLAAIGSASRGMGFLCSLVADLVCRRGADAAAAGFRPLTEREHDILQLIAQGLSNPQIARLRNLSVKTVQTHRHNIMTKLGVRGGAALVRRAMQLGLIAG